MNVFLTVYLNRAQLERLKGVQNMLTIIYKFRTQQSLLSNENGLTHRDGNTSKEQDRIASAYICAYYTLPPHVCSVLNPLLHRGIIRILSCSPLIAACVSLSIGTAFNSRTPASVLDYANSIIFHRPSSNCECTQNGTSRSWTFECQANDRLFQRVTEDSTRHQAFIDASNNGTIMEHVYLGFS